MDRVTETIDNADLLGPPKDRKLDSAQVFTLPQKLQDLLTNIILINNLLAHGPGPLHNNGMFHILMKLNQLIGLVLCQRLFLMMTLLIGKHSI